MNNKTKYKQYKIDDTVKIKNYSFEEEFKIIGVTKEKLLLDGDFSGGTFPVNESSWIDIDQVEAARNNKCFDSTNKIF